MSRHISRFLVSSLLVSRERRRRRTLVWPPHPTLQPANPPSQDLWGCVRCSGQPGIWTPGLLTWLQYHLVAPSYLAPQWLGLCRLFGRTLTTIQYPYVEDLSLFCWSSLMNGREFTARGAERKSQKCLCNLLRSLKAHVSSFRYPWILC